MTQQATLGRLYACARRTVFTHLIAIAAALLLWGFGQTARAASYAEAGFSEAEVQRPDGAATWNEAVGMDFSASGRMFVWERTGRVWIVDADNPVTQPFLNLSDEVLSWREHGLLGFALDPAFELNGHVYLLYAVDPYHLFNCDSPATGVPNCAAGYDPNTSWFATDSGSPGYRKATIGRVTRYTAVKPAGDTDFRRATQIDYSTRRVLLGETLRNQPKSTGIPLLYEVHGVGALLFGDDGSLLVSAGDSANFLADDAGSNGDTYYQNALADGILRQSENVGALRSQLVDSLNGKILRINPANGDGYSSNPFYDPSAPRAARSRVWTRGLRNPYRMALRPESGSHLPADGNPGVIMVGDVGYNSREEMNVVAAPGGNYGWPLFEGMTATTGYAGAFNVLNQDAPNPLFGASGCAQQYFRFGDLLVQDTFSAPVLKNPCDTTQPIPLSANPSRQTRPALEWDHNAAFPPRWAAYAEDGSALALPLGTAGPGGFVVTGSPFSGTSAIGGVFFEGTGFPAEYHDRLLFGDYAGQWIRTLDFDDYNQLLAVHPLATGTGGVVAFGSNHHHEGFYYIAWTAYVRHVTYAAPGSRPPVAVATATPLYGASPLTVTFSSAGSSDPEGGALTYAWDFGDGSSSTAANPQHVYTAPTSAPMSFTATLSVRDPQGLLAQQSVSVSLNNTPPVVHITSPLNGSTYPVPGSPVNVQLRATISDAQSTNNNLQCQWQQVLHHNQHEHSDPFIAGCDAVATISPVGCDGQQYWVSFRLWVTDPQGLVTKDEVQVYPACSGTPPDVTPPTIPTGLAATAQSATQIRLTWNASTDAGGSGLAGYRVLRNGVQVGSTTTLSHTDSALTPSTSYTYTVVAYDNAGPANESISAPVTASTLGVALRIKAAGGAFTDSLGQVWAADSGFNTGIVSTFNAPIAGTVDDGLYGSERYDAGSDPELQYSFNVPNGNYQVRLHFAENWATTAGSRVFDVDIEGVRRFDDIDIYAQSGWRTALVKTAMVSVTDGQLNILFLHQADNPLINAIEIIGQAPDTVAPTVPTGLTATPLDTTQIRLAWNASTDTGGSGVAGYRVLRNGTLVGTSTTLGYTDTALSPATSYTYTVASFDNATPANVSAPSNSVTASTPFTVMRINAGGGVFTDSLGQVWAADYGYNTGNTAGFNSPIANTIEDGLYQSERYDTDAAPDLQYDIAVPSGSYQVRLHFAENWATAGGMRVFDVDIEGVRRFDDIDVYAQAGWRTALVRSTTVEVFDGQLNIRFLRQAGDPLINAIELIGMAPVIDTTAPTVPTSLTATPQSSAQIRLDWNASTDTGGSGVAGYRVLRNGVQVGTSTTPGYTDTSLAATTAYTYTVVAFDNAIPSNASAPSASVTATTPSTLLRINAGGGGHTDSLGQIWAADYGYNTGNISAFNSAIASTIEDSLYQTERWDPGADPDLQYDIAVPNGSYQVRLHFAENWATAAGMRVFDVDIEGARRFDDIDVFAQAGWRTALVKTATVSIFDGQLNIRFLRQAGDPLINAIEVVGVAPIVDTTAPTVPTGLTATPQSATQIRLDWSASTDVGTGVAGYRVLRNGVQVGTSSTLSYTDTALTSGTSYSYTVAAFDNASPANASAPSASVTSSTPFTITRIRAGGGAFTDSLGQVWAADYGYNTGNVSAFNSPIANTIEDSLYQTERWDPGTDPELQYNLAVPNGLYQVRLHFAENWATAAGMRVFDVDIEGVRRFDDIDVFAQAGWRTALVKTATVSVFDGQLNIRFLRQAGDPLINAIELLGLAPAVDTTAPTVPTGLSATPLSATQIRLTWNASTDIDGTGVAGYRVLRNGVQTGTTTASILTYTDTSLTPNTAYNYTVIAFDNASPANVSAPSFSTTATTLPPPDTIAPSVPTGLTAATLSATQILLGWNASTDTGGAGMGGYRVLRNGAQVGTTTAGTLGFTDSGLAPTTAYSYTVVAFDNASPANASAPSTPAGATTLAPPDLTAPTVPTGLATLPLSTTQIMLAWNASTDTGGAGMGGYRVLRNGVQVGTTTSLGITDSGLSPNTTYSYTIVAFDNASPANVSGPSTAVSSTTLPPPDTIAPSVPTGVTATALDSTQIRLTWNASTDTGGSGMGGYRVLLNGVVMGTTSDTTTSYTDISLTPGTSYTYTVVAFDKATPVNVSAPSGPVTATTPTMVLRLNAGGGAFTDSAGRVWGADYGYNTGNTSLFNSPIANTIEDSLYQSERWDPSATPDLQYDLNVPNGSYQVRLHFAENWATAAGMRVFDVDMEGLRRFDDIDVYAQSGYRTALVRSTTVGVNDGQLNIRFLRQAGDPLINAIEIFALAPDTIAPSVPTGLAATVLTATQIRLAWNASSDGGTGVAGYRVLRNGLQVGTTADSILDYTDATLAPGTSYTYTVVAFDNGSPANVSAPSAPASATTPFTVLRINAGGGAITDSLGQVWAGDYGYNTGNTASFNTPIASTIEDGLYQSERYDTDSSPDLQYDIAVPNGSYQVRLHFAENWATAAGMRVFHVDIEGARRFTGIDIFGQSGWRTALVRSTTVNVFDGQLSIRFPRQAGDPLINAIELIGVGPAVDTVAPTVPTGVTAAALSATQVRLAWTASTDIDGAGVAGYRVLRNGVQVGTTAASTLQYTDTGLAPTTAYSYTIVAFDNALPVNVSAASVAAVATTPQTTAASPYLRVSGTQLVTAAGVPVHLRGINIGGWLVTENWQNGFTDWADQWGTQHGRSALFSLEARFGEARAAELMNIWQDHWMTTKDLDRIRDAGFNMIRVPFSYRTLQHADGSWILDSNGNIDFSRMDWILREAAERGMYTIFDLHIWPGQRNDYEGITRSSGQAARAAMADLWTVVAAHYRGNGAIAAFDVINELPGGDTHKELFDAIRRGDPDRVVAIEGFQLGDFRWRWDAGQFPNSIFSIHYYAGGYKVSTWDFQNRLQQMNGSPFPLNVGEFLAEDFGAATQLMNSANVHWSFWNYKTVDKPEWGLFNYHSWVRTDIQSDSFETIKSKWMNDLTSGQEPGATPNFSINGSIHN